MGILHKAKNKIAMFLAAVMVAGALPCYMASAEGDAILVFDEEFNGSLTIDSADTTSGISAEKAYSGSSSLKVKGNSWSRSIKGSFDGGLDLGDYVDGGTISFYLFNPSTEADTFEIDIYDSSDVRYSYWTNIAVGGWTRVDIPLSSAPNHSTGTIDWSTVSYMEFASRPSSYAGWAWYVDCVYFTKDGEFPEIAEPAPDPEPTPDPEPDPDPTPDPEPSVGTVPEKNIWVFYDKAAGEETLNNASLDSQTVYSGDMAIKLKGSVWKGNADYKITFPEAYDLSAYTSGKITVALYPDANATEGSNFQVDLYDIHGNRNGYFIPKGTNEAWTEHSINLQPASAQTLEAGQSAFDFANVSEVILSSRPNGGGSWYWYVDELKLDLGLGDEALTVTSVTNGKEGGVDEAQPMVFQFSENLDASIFDAVTISANGKDAEFEGVYADGKYTITFKEGLIEYLEYVIDFSSVKNPSGLPLDDEYRYYTFYKKATYSASLTNNNGQATAEITKNQETDHNPLLVAVLYNLDMSIADINIVECPLSVGESDTFTVAIPEFDGQHKSAVMLIESLTSPKHIAPAMEFGPMASVTAQVPFSVTATGDIGEVYGTMVILEKGIRFDNIASLSADEIKERILNIAVVKTDAEGKAEYKFTYNGEESEIGNDATFFDCIMEAPGLSVRQLIPYFTENTMTNYINTLKDCTTKEEFGTKFRTDAFDCNKSVYNQLTDKAMVSDIVYNIGFEDEAGIKKAIEKASCVAALNQGITANVNELMATISDQSASVNPLYQKLNQTGITNVKNAVVGKGFTNDTQAYKAYFERVIVNAITNYSIPGYEQVNSVLKLSGIDLTKYNASANQGYIDSRLVLLNINTLSDIEREIAVLAGGTTSGGGGSSGGGGGSSSGGSSSTTTPPKQSTKRPGLVLEGNNPTEEGFTDLADYEWAKNAILSLSNKGIVYGIEDGVFAPGEAVTREQFAIMLVRALGIETAMTEEGFTDVNADHWAYRGIMTAAKAGIVAGNTDGSFGLGEKITRQDIAVMVYRASGLEMGSEKLDFTDSDEIADYAKEAVEVLTSNKILSGMGDGTFAPMAEANRAQAAQIIYNLINGR